MTKLFEDFGRRMDEQFERMTKLADEMFEKVKGKSETITEASFTTKTTRFVDAKRVQAIIDKLGVETAAEDAIFVAKDYSIAALRADLKKVVGE